MRLKRLFKQQWSISFDIKYFVIFGAIMLFAMGVPFYSLIRSFTSVQQSEILLEEKASIVSQLQLFILMRFSLTVYIFSAWGFIPKLFSGGKADGEVDCLLTIGYSAKEVWLVKCVTAVISAATIAIPINVVALLTIRYVAVSVFNIAFSVNVVACIFGFVINLVVISLIVGIVGGIQLITDDVRKSSFAIFFIGFANMFIVFFTNPSKIDIKSIYVYAGICIALTIAILLMRKIMTTENVILSKVRIRKERNNRR